ncbi:oligosaccharide flippase family protein [Algoriella sp.]|uniref:oligosaccharide flippase family protein n=1 Tax=Algoriella sp. TaxID=1872434 RepID=UPI002FCBC067
MKEEKHYKTLFKATSLFGLVEILRLLLKIITNWAASNFLGTKGFGLVGLIENTVQLISSFSSLGINFTGVREIAVNKTNDVEFQKTIKAISQFSLFTGILSAIISIIFASRLSLETFKTTEYFYWFIALSVYFVATSYTQSKIIYLEGSQNFQKLVRINVIVNVLNSIIVLAAYYFFKTQVIIIAMIINSVIALFFYTKLSNIPKTNVELTPTERKLYFKKFIKSGSLLALNTSIGLACFFIIRKYFVDTNEEILSFYNAGNLIIVSYLGIIFIAMGKFFFPKLSQSAKDHKLSNQLINNQLELSLLIILPAIILIYTFSDFFIKILFSSACLPVYKILIFGLISIVFRSFNYAVGYLLLSHQNFRQYFYINAVSDILNTVLTILFYEKWGLIGIGFSIFINYLFSSIYIYYYTNKKYSFKISNFVKNQFFITLIVISIILCTNFLLDKLYFTIISGIFFVISTIYSIKKIDEYILDFKIRNKFKSLF